MNQDLKSQEITLYLDPKHNKWSIYEFGLKRVPPVYENPSGAIEEWKTLCPIVHKDPNEIERLYNHLILQLNKNDK